MSFYVKPCSVSSFGGRVLRRIDGVLMLSRKVSMKLLSN
jgi:hypothetical protein